MAYPRRQQNVVTRSRTSGTGSVGVSNRFIQSRGFIVVLLAVLGALIVSVTKETVRRVQIHNEIVIMEKAILAQKERNTETQTLGKILNTSAAQEKQSRVTLNTITPGETVVVLRTKTTANKGDSVVLPTGANIDTVAVQGAASNIAKWARYFFGNK